MTDYQLSLKIFLGKISFKFFKMNRFNLYRLNRYNLYRLKLNCNYYLKKLQDKSAFC